MKIGITGSSGFIGRNLTEELKKRKDVQLFYFDLPKNNLLKQDSSLERFVSGKDIIIHAAAVNRGSDEEIIEGNIVSTYNLLSVIKKISRKPKLLFLSSIQAETNTVYGQCKRIVEIMLKDFADTYKMPIIALRIVNVFGEKCKPFYNSVVATFCYQIANNKKVIIIDKNKIVNLIYIKNLVKSIVKEIFIVRERKFYLKKIYSGNIITIGKLANLIKSFDKIKNQRELKVKFYKDLYQTYLSYKK
jgi:UDP-2-acetamido-2,6-beta-L-arabino-hexul-4-ose reductase